MDITSIIYIHIIFSFKSFPRYYDVHMPDGVYVFIK